jgi:hypothetical protein
MKRLFGALIIFFFLQLGTTPILAKCQEGDFCAPNPACEGINPLSEVFSPASDNHILMENLSNMEVINFDNSLSGFTGYQYTYYRYITPCGNVVIMPATFTSLFATLDPSALPPEGWLGIGTGLYSTADGMASIRGMRTPSGKIVGEMIDGVLQLCGVLPEEENEFYQDMLNGQGCAWTMGYETASELSQFWSSQFVPEKSENNPLGIMPSAVLVYPAADCAKLDRFGGCPCDPEPPASATQCPAPTITTQIIYADVKKIAPVNPVVIGQDPQKRGADIEANVTVPPVVYTWYEAIPVYGEYCKPWRWGDEGEACQVNWYDAWNTGTLQTYISRYECRQHVEIYPDQVVSMSVSSVLSTPSRGWITGDLATKWYNAVVKQPTFMLVPGYGTYTPYCDGAKVCRGQADALRVPFRDPGNFLLQLTGMTRGHQLPRRVPSRDLEILI